jgi:hypothetical protein
MASVEAAPEGLDTVELLLSPRAIETISQGLH